MKTVWKFPLKIIGEQLIKMPLYTEIIHVGLDPKGVPCLWGRVDTVQLHIEREFYVTGTGHPLPDGDNRHVGSFVDGAFVWHVWMPY